MGDLVNLRNVVDLSIVAIGAITGLPDVHTFHCVPIPSPFVHVKVIEVFRLDVGLPIVSDEQKFLSDVEGMNTLWNSKFLKKTS